MSSVPSKPAVKNPDPRLQVKLSSALMPPRPRYREKSLAELRKMEPLDELPEALIPGRVPGVVRLPPLLRKGYRITRETICRLVEEVGFSPVTEGINPRFMAACLDVEYILSVRLDYRIECCHVYGIPGPDEESFIVSVAESYTPDDEMPMEIQEEVKEELRFEGPAKWYLDTEYSQWDWKSIYGPQY